MNIDDFIKLYPTILKDFDINGTPNVERESILLKVIQQLQSERDALQKQIPSRPKLGKIIVYGGPMFSQKTLMLINGINECIMFGIPYLALKLKGDDRYSSDDVLSSYSGSTTPAFVMTAAEADAWLVEHPEVKMIYADEAQFKDGIVECAIKWKLEGRTVHLAALNGSFEKKPFEIVVQLGTHLDQYHAMQGCCMAEGCQERATYSHRKDTSDTALQSLGGRDKYVSLCLFHSLEKDKV
jgi:thymidine kinase